MFQEIKNCIGVLAVSSGITAILYGIMVYKGMI